MKKNLLYLMLLLVVGAATYYFVFKKDTPAFSEKEANFTVKDTNNITTIFLASMQNEQIKLSRNEDGWIMNDSVPVRIDAVQALLESLAAQRAEQPVAMSYHDNVIKELSGNSTKVEIYKGKEKTNTFYVGKNPGTNNVTYMLNEGAERPYIVKLPLQNMFLGIRYFTTFKDWINKKILYQNAPIESVEVAYKDSTQFSFKVMAEPMAVTGQTPISSPLNLNRVKSYFNLLNEIYCVGYENENGNKDSILNHGKQLATISVKRKGKAIETLVLYFRPPDKGTKAKLKLDGVEYDFDWFFGFMNGKDFILINRKNAEKMLRSYPEFFQS
jgi:hypothetical protein